MERFNVLDQESVSEAVDPGRLQVRARPSYPVAFTGRGEGVTKPSVAEMCQHVRGISQAQTLWFENAGLSAGRKLTLWLGRHEWRHCFPGRRHCEDRHSVFVLIGFTQPPVNKRKTMFDSLFLGWREQSGQLRFDR